MESVSYWLLWWSYCVPYGSVYMNSMQTPSVQTSATGTFLGCLPKAKKKKKGGSSEKKSPLYLCGVAGPITFPFFSMSYKLHIPE